MFLYARIVLSNLHSQTTKRRLRAELEPNVFPKGLEAAYVESETLPTKYPLVTNFLQNLGTIVWSVAFSTVRTKQKAKMRCSCFHGWSAQGDL
jgi:hypothetical protein